MTNFLNVFLLNLVFLSERYQIEAVVLDPTLEKINFEIEDSQFNEFENLPKPLTHFPEPNEDRGSYYDNPIDQFSSRNDYSNRLEGDAEALTSIRGLPDCGKLQQKIGGDWQYGPLAVSKITASMKKWNVLEEPRLTRNLDRLRRPARFVDYTNSQMPFNEGKLRRKSDSTKSPEVSRNSFENGKTGDDFVEYAEPRRKRSGKLNRRHVFETPLRSRVVEIPRDDPLLEISRVRRFLDHKRSKKQIEMTSTLEAKEAAMSRVLDPNLNLDGILEPHVRKRRGLHTKKRDLSFKPKHFIRLRSKRHQKTTFYL